MKPMWVSAGSDESRVVSVKPDKQVTLSIGRVGWISLTKTWTTAVNFGEMYLKEAFLSKSPHSKVS